MKEIYILVDESIGVTGARRNKPTRRNIRSALEWLMKGAESGDSLFLYYSGHGKQVRDKDGDECDGLDEAIVSMDNGVIVDDELHETLVAPLPKGARLSAIFDCNHSASVLDLPYTHDVTGRRSGMVMDKKAKTQMAKSAAAQPSSRLGYLKMAFAPDAASDVRKVADPNAGEVLLFSSCRDNEEAADTGKTFGRNLDSMSAALILAIENAKQKQDLTYRNVLQKTREMLRASGLRQAPQLSTSHPFDIDTEFMV